MALRKVSILSEAYTTDLEYRLNDILKNPGNVVEDITVTQNQYGFIAVIKFGA